MAFLVVKHFMEFHFYNYTMYVVIILSKMCIVLLTLHKIKRVSNDPAFSQVYCLALWSKSRQLTCGGPGFDSNVRRKPLPKPYINVVG